jgi:hypothetical protein
MDISKSKTDRPLATLTQEKKKRYKKGGKNTALKNGNSQKKKKKKRKYPGMAVYFYNPSTGETEARGLRVQGQPGLHSEILS